MHSLKESLQKTLKKLGVEKEIKERRIVQIWNEIRQGELIEHTQAKSFKNGLLFVNVSSPVWSQQLLFLKGEIIKQINQKVGGRYLKDIRFQCGSIEKSAYPHTIIIDKEWEQIFLSEEEIEKIKNVSDNLGKKEIKEAIFSFLIKNKKLKKWREKQGWRTCSYCSCVYPPQEKKCPYCCWEKELKLLFYNNPWLTLIQCQETMPNLDEQEFLKIKEQIIKEIGRKLEKVVEKDINSWNKNKLKKWLNIAQFLIILKTGLELFAIEKDVVYQVLGKNMADLYYNLKNKNKEGV